MDRDKSDVRNNGKFFCHACLADKTNQSPDPRYCRGCYELLLKEAEMDTRRKDSDWKPITPTPEPKIGDEKLAQAQDIGRTIMATLESDKIKVDIIPLATPTRSFINSNNKRGPKPRTLPTDPIMQWASKGLGSKAISTRLKKDLGVTVNYKTIQRRLITAERK